MPGADVQQVAVPHTERACCLVEWKPWPFDNPALIGHYSVSFAGGWVVHQIPVFRSRERLGVGVPNAALLDAEGRIKLRDGKRQYVSVLTFETAEGRERWRRMALGALAAAGVGGDAP